jgi:hypothetical protein
LEIRGIDPDFVSTGFDAEFFTLEQQMDFCINEQDFLTNQRIMENER